MALRSRDVEVDLDELDDVEVARRAAAGDAAAFATLYLRHAGAAWRVANAVAADREDAADAVAEAFTHLLQALVAGRLNPEVPFRPYLMVTVRNAAIDQHRVHARVHADTDAAEAEPAPTITTPGERAEDALDASLIVEAFRTLPERWRTVLWLTEVENVPAREVGALLGLSPNSAAQLAHRARNGLRERFVQAHLRHHPEPACEETVSQLGAYTTGGLTPRATARVDQHLAGCEECRKRVAELADVGGSLRTLVVPLPLALAPAALARFRAAFAGTAARAATQAPRGVAAWAASTTSGGRMTRALAVTTSALLALGVITAGLMSNSGGPVPVPGSKSGGAVVAAPATSVSQIPGSDQFGTADHHGANPARTLLVLSAPPTTVVTNGSSGQPSAPQSTVKSKTLPGHHSAPPPPTTTTAPLLGVGANLAVASTSLSLSLNGGCTGVSLNGSASCAPAAPKSLGVSLTTPLGTIKLLGG